MDWLATIARDDPMAVPLLDRQEMAWVAALDASGNLRAFRRVAMGGCTEVAVHMPPVLAVPLLAGVDRFTLLHNHPSGSIHISPKDRELTKQVMHAGHICGMTLEDHVIVLPHGPSISLVARGVLAPAATVAAKAAE